MVLRQQMTKDIQVRKLSAHTQATYQQVSLFARNLRKSPNPLTPDHIRTYQSTSRTRRSWPPAQSIRPLQPRDPDHLLRARLAHFGSCSLEDRCNRSGWSFASSRAKAAKIGTRCSRPCCCRSCAITRELFALKSGYSQAFMTIGWSRRTRRSRLLKSTSFVRSVQPHHAAFASARIRRRSSRIRHYQRVAYAPLLLDQRIDRACRCARKRRRYRSHRD
jgi:hypothetical protein